MTTPTPPTAEQIRAARDQLTAILNWDDELDEQMPPSQRLYIAGTLSALEWIIEGGKPCLTINPVGDVGSRSDVEAGNVDSVD